MPRLSKEQQKRYNGFEWGSLGDKEIARLFRLAGFCDAKIDRTADKVSFVSGVPKCHIETKICDKFSLERHISRCLEHTPDDFVPVVCQRQYKDKMWKAIVPLEYFIVMLIMIEGSDEQKESVRKAFESGVRFGIDPKDKKLEVSE